MENLGSIVIPIKSDFPTSPSGNMSTAMLPFSHTLINLCDQCQDVWIFIFFLSCFLISAH